MVFCQCSRTVTKTDKLLDSTVTFSCMHMVSHPQRSRLLDVHPGQSNTAHEDVAWLCFFAALPKGRASDSKLPHIKMCRIQRQSFLSSKSTPTNLQFHLLCLSHQPHGLDPGLAMCSAPCEAAWSRLEAFRPRPSFPNLHSSVPSIEKEHIALRIMPQMLNFRHQPGSLTACMSASHGALSLLKVESSISIYIPPKP